MSQNNRANESRESGPFEAFQAMFAPWKSFAALPIDASEQFAKEMLRFQVSATEAFKDTPFGPVFQAVIDFNQLMIDTWFSILRSMLQLETPEAA